MVEVLPAHDRVAAFRISGLVTGEDIEKLFGEIDAKLEKPGRIGILSDLTEFSDATGEALAKRIQYGMERIRQWNRFARMAVISDKNWIRAVADWSSRIFPSIQVQVFGESDRQAAMEWVSALPAA